ncbi:MAG: DUF3344 domain-containing protein [Euryarchaeota archaeon]|nr:DUF3344 domain-containing protein [Euryarchaeota archaeon]
MKRTISLICIAVLMMVAPALAAPDLNVTDIHVNFGDERSDDIVRVYVNCENVISAVVQNTGYDAVTGDFEVCFAADGAVIGCANVTGGLATGVNTTVSIDWMPTCEDYQVMPGFPPQSLPLTITATADCNSGSCPNCPDDGSSGTINESDETNNVLSKDIPAIQDYPATNGVIGGVVNNGYMSKNFDCGATEPLYTARYFDVADLNMVTNVSGAKIGTFATQATATRIHHIDLPDGAVAVGARLYVNWHDQSDNYKTYPTGCLANLSVEFEGVDFMPEVVYYDSKAFGCCQSPKGCAVFNVTSQVNGPGDYTAIVKNIEPIGGNNTTLLGQGLGVLYIGAGHGGRVQLWVLEGTDHLMAADGTHGDNNYSVSPEAATATIAIPAEIDLTDVVDARLTAFVAQGMAPGSDLLFNGEVIKADAWDASTEAYPGSKVNREEVSVRSKLLSSGNTIGFRDNGSNGMQATCATLIVVHGELTPGDLNGDGVLTTADSVLALQIAVRGEYSGVADVNGDDTVTSIDALMILQAAVKNIEL